MRILLIVYDNDSYISYFPLGLAYVAAACRQAGHEVVIYNQDIYHWPESHLTAFLDNGGFDVVGVGVVGGYYQYRKLLKISEAVNRSRRRPVFLIGGHGPSPEPEFFLRKTGADYAVIGEGERTVVELLSAVAGKSPADAVKGIAFLRKGRCIQTPRRDPEADIDSLPLPAWGMFPIDHYVLLREPHSANRDRYMTVLSGRGCTFHCNFCYRMDPGYRSRSAESIVEEVGRLQKDYGISYVEFLDELLMSSPARTTALCQAFIKAKLGFKWYCNGRLNYATADVLRLMKEAGCVFINYGIESLDEQALRTMNKALTVKQIVSGIENTLASGISPGFNIIFGNIGETADSLDKGVEFLLKYDDHAQLRTIRPVTPYPGSPLYYYAIEHGLLKDCEDFYENKHRNSDLLTVNFTDMTDEEFYQALLQANKRLIENYFSHKRSDAFKQCEKLYLDRDDSFRGFRQT